MKTIEFLAANIERGVDRARYYNINPSVLNLGAWLHTWVQHIEPFRDAPSLAAHGVALVGDMTKALEVLGWLWYPYNAYNPEEAFLVSP